MVSRTSRSLQEGSTKVFVVLGAALFGLLHVLFAFTEESIDWGEKSGIFFTVSTSKIKLTSAVSFLTTVIALSFVRQPRPVRVRAGLAMFAGSLIAMVVVLFIVGPGNLWPIVIVIGGILLAPAFLLGICLSLAVSELKDRWTRRKD